jgi:hypothetical protein
VATTGVHPEARARGAGVTIFFIRLWLGLSEKARKVVAPSYNRRHGLAGERGMVGKDSGRNGMRQHGRAESGRWSQERMRRELKTRGGERENRSHRTQETHFS